MKFWTAMAAIVCAGSAVLAADSPDVKKFTFQNDVEVYAIRDKATTMKGSLFSDYTKTSSLPLLCLEEFHDLRGTLQDEAGFMRKFETTHVGAAKC